MALRFFSFLAIGFFALAAQAHKWEVIDTGLRHTATKDLHVFRIDPEQFRFQVVEAKTSGKKTTTAKALAKQSNAILVINGGFFDKSQKSLGLLVNNGKELNPKHGTTWWHIFQVRKNRGKLVSQKHFRLHNNTEMAIQAGPRLIINNQIPKLKFSLDRRSGIGVHKDGDILIAVSNETEMSLSAFAHLLNKKESEGGFDAKYALNLDGGNSSQLYIHWKEFEKEVRGFSSVPNGIGIFPAEKPVTEPVTDSSN